MLTLYTTPLSANGRKVLALSHHLGLSPEIRLVNVYRGEGRAAEYLAINPAGKIPTLVDDDFALQESNAILIYLAEAYGDHRLWSREPRARAAVARWLFWESAHWDGGSGSDGHGQPGVGGAAFDATPSARPEWRHES